MSEFNLSEKRKGLFQRIENEEFKDTLSSSEYEKIFYEIEMQDKEFIKRLKEEDWGFYDKYIRDQDLDKEEIVKVCFDYINNRIEKLAGDKYE